MSHLSEDELARYLQLCASKKWDEAEKTAGSSLSDLFHPDLERTTKEALAYLFRNSPDAVATALAFRFVGDVLYKHDIYDQARLVYIWVLEVIQNVNPGDLKGCAQCMRGIANSYFMEGDESWEAARRYYLESLSLAGQCDAVKIMAEDWRQLANLAAMMVADLENAESYILMSLNVFVKEKHKIGIISATETLCRLVNLFVVRGENLRAERLLSSGKEILKGVKDAETATTVNKALADRPKHIHSKSDPAINPHGDDTASET